LLKLDGTCIVPQPGAMDVNLTPELQAKLDRVASENRRGVDGYVQELVASHLDHDVWFRGKVKASLSRLDSGEFLSHEEIGLNVATIVSAATTLLRRCASGNRFTNGL